MGDKRQHYGQLQRGTQHMSSTWGTYVETPGWNKGRLNWLSTDCRVLVAKSSLVCRVCNTLVRARSEFITVPVGKGSRRAAAKVSVCVPCFNAKRLEAAAAATPGSGTAAPPPPSTAGPGASGTPGS